MKTWVVIKEGYSEPIVFSSESKYREYIESVPNEKKYEYTLFEVVLDSEPPENYVQVFANNVSVDEDKELKPQYFKADECQEGCEVYLEVHVIGKSFESQSHARTLALAGLERWQRTEKDGMFYTRTELEERVQDERPLDVFKNLKPKL